ncbi:unnamed protein product [Acanthoscelides obtectus]|uniref:MADF domain-containing protein n=1 Tax=Acanthoscelides obtectus TaxID=200917 RepID=A0A9P0LRJ5_ACAOB|nr:unnamed protein product [Acanthoscelides obtectus]CAK1654815.1 hypothetical protein AOBTE_LOCUS18867 [Acanthoscelides obtectus]
MKDVGSNSYHKRNVGRKLWREIAEELNSTSEATKGKWQNLRDNFRREHAKISNAPTGSAALGDTQISSWKYYKQLSFLIGAFSSRRMKTNMPSVLSQTSELADILNEEEEHVARASNNTIDPNCAISNSTVETQESETPVDTVQTDPFRGPSVKSFKKPLMTTKQKIARPDALAKLVLLEQRKVEQLEKRYERSNTSEDLNKDDDCHCLMSLLPHLRDIPKKKKLATRMRLQQVRPNSATSSYSYNYCPQCSTP